MHFWKEIEGGNLCFPLSHTKGQGGLSAMSTGGHRPKDINSRIKIVEYNTRGDNTMPETITIC